MKNDLDAELHHLRALKFGLDTRSLCVAHCAREAGDILEAVSEVLARGLRVASWVLSRALLERLFWMAWCVETEDRAQTFAAAWGVQAQKWFRAVLKNQELATPVTKVLQEGGADDETLEGLRGDPEEGLPKIQMVAEEAGLKKTYDLRYRSECITAHGNTFGMSPELRDHAYQVCIVGTLRTVRAIRLVATNWTERSAPTSGDQIEQILWDTTRVGNLKA